MRGLGQVLKSFRDRPVDFPVYDRLSGSDAYLKTLGSLAMPSQGSVAGLTQPDQQTGEAANLNIDTLEPAVDTDIQARIASI
jgi:hypothetical protein